MRRFLPALLLLFAPLAFAQNQTIVTGTITDPSGIPYYPATVSACLTPATLYPMVAGQQVNNNPGTNYCFGPVSTASNGSFLMSLWGNALITCSPACAATQWLFTVVIPGPVAPVGFGPQQFTATITISGSSQDIGATLNAAGVSQLRPAGAATNATNLVGPGTITGTFSGTHTETGNVTFTGTDTAGTFNKTCTVDGVQYTTIAAASAGCGAGTHIKIPSGNYTVSTTITPLTSQWFECDGSRGTTINWTGSSSGAAINAAGIGGFRLSGCGFTTAVGGTSVAVKIAASVHTIIENNYFGGSGSTTGFGTDIQLTGDGVSLYSSTVFINNNRFENYIGSAVNIDHTFGSYLTANSAYSSANNTTVQNLILDTGAKGVQVDQWDSAWGLHGLTIRNTNQGGSYGTLPSFLFFSNSFLADTTSGGDGILFDSTLGANAIFAQFKNCWAAAAGLNNALTIITAGANGVHISGGTAISFQGYVKHNALNGILIDNANVAEVAVEPGTKILGNNQSNNADAHGVYITAAAPHIQITGTRISNAVEVGGNQVYGVKVTAVNADQLQVVGNDLGGNVTGGLLNSNTGNSWVLGNFPDTTTNVIRGPSILTGNLNFNNNPLVGLNALTPNAAGVGDIGSTALPFPNLWLGTAATNNFKFQPATTAAARTVNLWDFGANGPSTQNYPGTTILTSQYTNSTTGFTNVAGGNTIQFPVLANTTYTAECHLYYQSAATGGLNIEFTGPASPTTVIYGLDDPSSATAFNSAVATAYGTSLGQVVGTAATNFDALVSFSLINGANAGTVNLLAKSTAAVQLQIQAGSFCRIQ